jgi:hypothetical protein
MGMMNRARSTDPIDKFKQQAKVLKDFLRAGGHDLKHTHALEAIARINGFDDFHLLAHAASTPSVSTWVIATYGAGILPHLALASSLKDGVGVFVHQLARICSDEGVEIRIRARDEGPHSGLYAMHNGALLCSMTRPPRVTARYNTSAPSPFTASLSLAEIAVELTWAMNERGGWERFMESVHDEGFDEHLRQRLEDAALQGVTGPEYRELSVERLDAIVEAAHMVTIAVDHPDSAGGSHE